MSQARPSEGPATRRRHRNPRQLLTLVAAALVALAARSSLADHYVVPSGSMLPTVQEGDRIFVDKLAYGVRLPFSQLYLLETSDPSPGDVVVLVSPEGGHTLLKRVVAASGDLIEVVEGRIVLNGSPIPIIDVGGRLMEELGGSMHSVRITNGGGPDFGPVVVPEGQYLVMGDNRGDSHDGRIFGLVPRSSILGRAVGSFYVGGELSWRPL